MVEIVDSKLKIILSKVLQTLVVVEVVVVHLVDLIKGSSGIVIVRYPIGSVGDSAKATGGLISFRNNKTAHVTIGEFINTSDSI